MKYELSVIKFVNGIVNDFAVTPVAKVSMGFSFVFDWPYSGLTKFLDKFCIICLLNIFISFLKH